MEGYLSMTDLSMIVNIYFVCGMQHPSQLGKGYYRKLNPQREKKVK